MSARTPRGHVGTLCRISEIIPAALLATAFGESGKSTHPGVLGEFGAVAARRTRFLYERNGAAIELPLVVRGCRSDAVGRRSRRILRPTNAKPPCVHTSWRSERRRKTRSLSERNVHVVCIDLLVARDDVALRIQRSSHVAKLLAELAELCGARGAALRKSRRRSLVCAHKGGIEQKKRLGALGVSLFAQRRGRLIESELLGA